MQPNRSGGAEALLHPGGPAERGKKVGRIVIYRRCDADLGSVWTQPIPPRSVAMTPKNSKGTVMADAETRSPVNKALFVRLRAKPGKEADVEAFLRDGLAAVMEERDTTTWYAVRFGHDDFAIFDTFPSDAGRLAHLAGKVGRALVARTPELLDGLPKIEDAQVLAYKLTDQSGEIRN